MSNPICLRCDREIVPGRGNRFGRTHLNPIECISNLRGQRNDMEYRWRNADSAVNWLLEHPAIEKWRPSLESQPDDGEWVLIYSEESGYDLVTGLGSPDVENLVKNILVLQKAHR